MKDTIVTALVTAAMVVVAMFVFGLVSDNQSDLGAGTRFPNGISADSTSPSAGQVRGTTFTSTGAATLASLSVTGATTLTGAVTLSSTLNFYEKTEAITASNTLLAAESGTVFYGSGAPGTTTLPTTATATGTVFVFVVAGALSTDWEIISAGGASGDDLEGAIDINSTITTVDAADKILIKGDAENLGDTYIFRSDGQKWFVTGACLNASCAAASG